MSKERLEFLKVLGTSNRITTTIGWLLLFLMFGVPIIFMMFDNSALFWGIVILVTAILLIGLQIWVVHFLINFMQDKNHLKYRINFIKLFLTVIISIILLAYIYGLFVVPDAEISPIVKWYLPVVFIPAVISVAKGVIIKADGANDKELHSMKSNR